MPSIAELRVRTQPDSIFARNSGEHWAGRLYMRRASPYLTRLLIPTRITPNGVTWLMIAVGLAAAAVLTLPGWWPPVVVVALIQCQLLLDCSDGELARWRGVSSPAGIYLDRMAHYLTEAALPVALAIRADGGWDSIGGWTDLGLLTAVLVLIVRIEYTLVYVARAESGPAGRRGLRRRGGAAGRRAWRGCGGCCPSRRSSARSWRSSSPSSR